MNVVLAWRILAYFIDCALLLGLVASSQFLLVTLGAHPFVTRRGTSPIIPSTDLLHLWVFTSTTLPFIAYFALSFCSAHGATVGQRLVKLRVNGTDGGKLAFAPALLRALVLLVPFEVNHAVMLRAAPWAGGSNTAFALGNAAVALLCLLYLLLPLIREDGRSVHDLAARSTVRRQ